MTHTIPSTPSAIDRIADSYVEKATALNPLLASGLGVPGHDRDMPDLSPAGLDAEADLARTTLADLDDAEAAARDAGEELSQNDRLTLAAMRERLGLDLEMHEKLIPHSQVNNITSPIQGLRAVFDQMPTTGDTDAEAVENWDVIRERLTKIPAALEGFAESLRFAADKGVLSAQRQLRIGAEEAHGFAAADGFFAQLITQAPSSDEQLAAGLRDAADQARGAYAQLADVLDELHPSAPEADAVGEDAYRLHSRAYIGAEIDLEDTYRWGVRELLGILEEQRQIAARINEHYGNGGGDDVDAAYASLNEDEAWLVHGSDNLKAWMQEKSDAAVAALADEHFDIPEQLHTLECMIATTGSGGIYYTPPSEDLTSRPGRMWWDVPEGVTAFHTWKETTTVYHEGVPGHHLQLGTQTMQAGLGRLNRWRALMCWISGYGEGWALYAERLMDELGFLAEDAERLGMLSEQRMRAGRVVLDIGLHTGRPVPEEFGGGEWTYEKAWEFMTEFWGLGEEHRRFELHRYLGWPGQAPSYKVGQRVWERLRAESPLPSRQFHDRTLALGALPLSILEDAVKEMR